ncbi:MAG: glycosyltransferase 87 family protein [Bacteroidota bacterium]
MSRGVTWLAVAASVVAYTLVSFFVPRTDSAWLLGTWPVLFIAYWVLTTQSELATKHVILLGLVFRVLFLFSLPALSDDFYRFVWDGRLWHAGIHPFLFVPSQLVDRGLPGIDQALFQLLNSKEYFTVYPPFSQAVFWFSVTLSPASVYGSMLIMKITLLLAEAGTLLLLVALLRMLGLPERNLGWYAFNPLAIVELTGNLHFEGIMIFFFLLAIWLLQKKRHLLAALSWSLAIAVKLLPIIFLPVLLFHLGLKRATLFYLYVALFSLALFSPLYSQQVVDGFSEGLRYYFQKFEFNASIYYLVREWGFAYYGYNIVQTVGWKLALVATLLMLSISWGLPRYFFQTKAGSLNLAQFFALCALMLTTYLLFSTTVHPWYVVPVVALHCLGTFRFGMVWSALIFLTYAGYRATGYHENLWIVAVEYLVVMGFLIWELSSPKFRMTKPLQHLA